MRFRALLAVSVLGAASGARAQEDAGAAPVRWCAEELTMLDSSACYFSPEGDDRAKETLVIFLHGVIKDGTTWQWAQQRSIARAAKKNGFSVLMPRGRQGIGPKGMRDWWTWPTSVKAENALGTELRAEWKADREQIEKDAGHGFSKIFVIGFSNGAYYATSLALLGKTKDVDGFAVFAGGAGAKYLVGPAQGVPHRPPSYVGYGLRDKAHHDPEGLAKALKRLGWRHRVGVSKHGGHSMPDSKLADAIRFLRGG